MVSKSVILTFNFEVSGYQINRESGSYLHCAIAPVFTYIHLELLRRSVFQLMICINSFLNLPDNNSGTTALLCTTSRSYILLFPKLYIFKSESLAMVIKYVPYAGVIDIIFGPQVFTEFPVG